MQHQMSSSLQDAIRGEKSAVETYSQVLEKIDNPQERNVLESMRADHVQAFSSLKNLGVETGNDPDVSSGAWGSFAKAVTGTAKLFGNKSALKALKEGEEHGLKLYRRALDDQNLEQEARRVISTELLPKQEHHISEIDRLMAH